MKNFNGRYILDKNGKPVPEPDLMKWAKWLERSNRILARTPIGKVVVSTVFLGLDHSFFEKKPVLWETMIFGSKLKGLVDYQVRYTSRNSAIKGHEDAVKFAKNMLKK